MLFWPGVTPDRNGCIQWDDSLNMYNDNQHLSSPFNFEPVSLLIGFDQKN